MWGDSKFCIPELSPTSGFCPCGPYHSIGSLWKRLGSPGCLPSYHFLLNPSQRKEAPKWSQCTWHLSLMCSCCCWASPLPFLISIFGMSSEGPKKSTVVTQTPILQQCHLLFLPSLLPGIYITGWAQGQPHTTMEALRFSDKKPYFPKWVQVSFLIPSSPQEVTSPGTIYSLPLLSTVSPRI